jgi:hypothetical protein
VTPAIEARGARRAIAALAVLALLVAACGSTATPSPSSTSALTPAPSSSAPTAEPTPSEEPTEEPTPEPTATEEATPGEPTESPGEPTESPGATASPAAATDCTGSDDNRAFYAGVAADVAWDVYCPVLPARWFVDTGTFRLSGGGTMEISYKGPGGQRLAIREGHYCAGQTGCVPAGPDAGTASFGGRSARLVDAGGGAWLVFANGGAGLSWEARGTGMDGPTLAGYTAAFIKVGE